MVTGKDTASCNALVLKQLRSVGAPVWDDIIDDAYGCLAALRCGMIVIHLSSLWLLVGCILPVAGVGVDADGDGDC